MRTPAFITALVLMAILFPSCVKNNFTCDCYRRVKDEKHPENGEYQNSGGHYEYNIVASNRNNAKHDCKNFELKLAQNSDVYACILR